MKKRFIAAALGMILTICIVALPIVGVSADTINYNNLIISNAIEKTDVYSLKYNVWSTFSIQRTDETYSFNLNIDFFLIGNANVYIECYGKNDTLIEINFSTIEKFSGHYKNDINITSTTDIGRINLAFNPNENSILYLGSFGDKTSIGLYNTYIIENNKLLDEFVETNYNNAYESGLNYSKYGVFSGAEITSAKLDYNNWQPSELKINFINNGISFNSIAKQFDSYCYENSINELGFTITLSTVPFLWTNNNFFVNMSYGFSGMQIYDTNNKAYNVKIGNERNDFGYNLYATLSEETTTPEKPINKIVISYQSMDYCGIIYNPTGSSYSEGYTDGYNEGQNDGYQNGYYQGSQETYNNAYQKGYNTGYSKGYDQASKDIGNFFGYIAAIGEAPANMIQEMFNFEIMGIDVSTVIFALLTTALVVILLKKLT